MIDLAVRPAVAADAAEIARVHIASWRGGYRGLMPDAVLDGLSEESFTRHWEGRIRQAPRATLVAEGEAGIVGFATGGPARDADAVPGKTGELYALYLLPGAWGTGVARRLWRAMRQWLTVEEYEEATLWVLEGNFRARAFYERSGFLVDPGARRMYEREGAALPEVRYRTRLG